MTPQQAADSMRATALKLMAWAKACDVLDVPESSCLKQAMEREAQRLDADAKAVWSILPRRKEHAA